MKGILMQSEFDLVLEKLAEADTDNLVGQLQKLFISITKLSPDELVATYQTIKVISTKVSGFVGQQLIADIKKAIVAQMQQLVLQGIDTSAMRIRFEMVIGVRFQTRLDTAFEPQNW